MDSEQTANYSIKLDIFEGPLDLLLYLIKKNEVDIYNIPIALVTEQYLEYLKMIKALNLDLAGEYLRKYAKSHSVGIGDALIAGTAHEMKMLLVTRNVKHYPMKSIHLVKPY